MPIDQVHDIVIETDNTEYGKCIHAPESVFRMVAGILLKLSTEKPDASGIDNLDRDLIVDHTVQASFFAFALQCLGAALCNEGENMPQNLRTKPTDDCVLQQEQSGEYVDVFDFGACLALWINTVTEKQDEVETIRDLKDIYKQAPQDAEELLEKFQDLYQGTSESYNPDLVNDDLGKRAAICAALTEVLNGYVVEAQRLKQQELDGNGVGVLAIGAAAAIVGLLGAALIFPPSAAAAAALYGSMVGAGTLAMSGALLGASGAALAIFTEVVRQTSMPILQDENAKDEVLCAWFEVLKDDTDISHTDFKQALDMSLASTNGQALYGVIDSLRQIDLAYPAFLEVWAKNITFADAGAIYGECGCEEPEVQFYNLNGNYDDTIIQFIGYGAGGSEVWEFTLPAANLNASDAIVVRGLVDGGGNEVPFFVEQTTIIGGGFERLEAAGVPYGQSYPTDVQFLALTMYADDFPAKIRLRVNWNI